MSSGRSGALVVGAALLALSLAATGGCATKGHVIDKHTDLTAFLQGIDAPARICAPEELALARAHLEFAVYEVGQGQTHRAASHIDTAEKMAKEAWVRSRGDECEADGDLDGVRDSKDLCPEEPEDYDGDRDEDGCPDADRDGDGVDDETDRCPDEPEDMDGFQDEDGCPDADNDTDGIRDDLDQCPNEPEDKDGFQDDDGCPDPDNDADGVLDTADKCPNEPEDLDGVEDADGCPDLEPVKEYKTIVVTETRIELKQKIYFKSGKATILSKSFRLLDEVADVLITKKGLSVRIEGHTDSRGSATYNKKLSGKRADSVRSYLIAAGVESSRLVAVGYGEEVPIDSNDSKDGRARNRRVEFHIIQ